MLILFWLRCGCVEALSHPPTSRWTKGPSTQHKSVCVGERARVVVKGGAARKACKKQRRSRSPQLWPATVSRTGESCWLRLSPSQSFLAVENDTVLGVVVEAEKDRVVLSPVANFASRRLPDDALLLDSLKTGDPLDVKVVRMLDSHTALVSCMNVYRRAKTGGHRRLRVAMRLGEAQENGTILTAFVERAQPNSGKLTLSKDPVAKPDKTLNRIRRQIDRGTLHPGCQRIATIVDLSEDKITARVDAGGLRASVDLSAAAASQQPSAAAADDDDDNSQLREGDRITVRVLTICAETGEAT